MSNRSDRYEDASEVLDDARGLIDKIADTYAKATSDEELLGSSKTQMKGAVEGIRSALEYASQDIWRSYTTKKNSVYFPYGKDEAAFLASVKRNLPALKEQAPLLFALVESIQPHVTGSVWLTELCAVSNFNKHNGLSKQVRKNSPGNKITLGGGALVVEDSEGVVFVNAKINGVPLGNHKTVKVSNSASTSSVRHQVNEKIHFEREFDWVEFHIDVTGADALRMLEQSHAGVSEFVTKIYKELDKLA